MARISSYAIDSNVELSDKVLGTDSQGLVTKNFDFNAVKAWLNSTSVVGIVGQNSYRFETIGPRGQGTVSFPSIGGDETPFSNITQLVFSTVTAGNYNAEEYLNLLVNKRIIFSDVTNPANFGIFTLTALTDHSEGFLLADLTFEDGIGEMTADNTYGTAPWGLEAPDINTVEAPVNPKIQFIASDKSNPVSGEHLGTIAFKARFDDPDVVADTFEIQTEYSGADGNFNADLVFNTNSSGTLTEKFRFKQDGELQAESMRVASLSYPVVDGSTGQIIQTDGAGNLSFTDLPNSAAWGGITGALSSQIDLQNALNAKENLSNKSTATSLGTSNTVYPSQNAVKVYVDNGLSAKENTSNKSTDVTLGGVSPSSTFYTTEYAVATYVQNEIAQAQSGIPTFEIDMFANYKIYESDEDGTTTYVGKIKATNGNWLVERYVDNSGDITATYANASNNAAQTTPTLAWTNRATLTYAAVNNLTSI